MKQIDFIKNSSGAPPVRIKSAYGSVPSYKSLPQNACFLEPRANEQITVIQSPVTHIRKGMTIRLRPEFIDSDTLQAHYLFGVHRKALHVVLHVEAGVGCLKARRNGSWVDMISPATQHFFEEVKVGVVSSAAGLEASKKVTPTQVVPIPDVTSYNKALVPLNVRLDTFDRMFGHAIDFTENKHSSNQSRSDELFDIASNLTDKALAKYSQ